MSARSTPADVERALGQLDQVLVAMPGARVWAPPARPLPEEGLRIKAVAELNTTLLLAAKGADPPKKYLAEQAGITRSQLYRFTDPNKPTLPRDPQDVRALLEACSVPNEQVVQILECWTELDASRYRPADSSGDAAIVSETGPATLEEGGTRTEPLSAGAEEDDVVLGTVPDDRCTCTVSVPPWAALTVISIGVLSVLVLFGAIPPVSVVAIVLIIAVALVMMRWRRGRSSRRQ
jgi:hypothetical protein